MVILVGLIELRHQVHGLNVEVAQPLSTVRGIIWCSIHSSLEQEQSLQKRFAWIIKKQVKQRHENTFIQICSVVRPQVCSLLGFGVWAVYSQNKGSMSRIFLLVSWAAGKLTMQSCHNTVKWSTPLTVRSGFHLFGKNCKNYHQRYSRLWLTESLHHAHPPNSCVELLIPSVMMWVC